MPELNWVGKDKVITHHLDVPYRVLDRQYSYDEHGQHQEDNGLFAFWGVGVVLAWGRGLPDD